MNIFTKQIEGIVQDILRGRLEAVVPPALSRLDESEIRRIDVALHTLAEKRREAKESPSEDIVNAHRFVQDAMDKRSIRHIIGDELTAASEALGKQLATTVPGRGAEFVPTGTRRRIRLPVRVPPEENEFFPHKQQTPKLANDVLRLRDAEFENARCSNCKLFEKPTTCKILVGPVTADQVCDAIQGIERLPDYKISAEDFAAFAEGMRVAQPYQHIVVGGHDTPVGPILVIEDTMKPQPHRFSLTQEFSIRHTSREHIWSQQEVDAIAQIGRTSLTGGDFSKALQQLRFHEERVRQLFEAAPDEIMLVPDWTSITGSVLYAKGNRQPNDLDVVLKDPNLPPGPALKISRMFESLTDLPVQMIHEAGGPTWPYVPIYDLVARKRPNFELRNSEHPSFESYRKQLAASEPVQVKDALEKFNAGLEAVRKGEHYLQYPEGGEKPYKAILQNHWRGKSVHLDWRVSKGDFLVGYTINHQVAGKVKKPVETMTEARRLAAQPSAFKINPKTGEFAQRRIATGEVRRTQILTERKAPQPVQWLKVEGVTKPLSETEEPGGTKMFPGVFHVLDRFECEYGALKPDIHEYFCHGKVFKGRIFVRPLELSKCFDFAKVKDFVGDEKKQARRALATAVSSGVIKVTSCEVCGIDKVEAHHEDYAQALNVRWLCRLHHGEQHTVPTMKQVALPPSEEQGIEGPSWVLIKPDSQLPNVLAKSSREEKPWVPPMGWAALPADLRRRVPANLRYWTKTKESDRSKLRNMLYDLWKEEGLIKQLESGEFKFSKIEPVLKKQQVERGKFVLHRRFWKVRTVVRTGPSKEFHHVRLDFGKSRNESLELDSNPLTSAAVGRYIKSESKALFTATGVFKPKDKLKLNPLKVGDVTVEEIDKGTVERTVDEKGVQTLTFKGKQMKGRFTARDEGGGIWSLSKVSKLLKHWHKTFRFEKRDDAKRIVWGVVYAPFEVDRHGDWMTDDDVQFACEHWLSEYRKYNEMHREGQESQAVPIQCFIAPKDFLLGKRFVKKGSWVLGTKILDDVLWKKILNGTYNAYSIEGRARGLRVNLPNAA